MVLLVLGANPSVFVARNVHKVSNVPQVDRF